MKTEMINIAHLDVADTRHPQNSGRWVSLLDLIVLAKTLKGVPDAVEQLESILNEIAQKR